MHAERRVQVVGLLLAIVALGLLGMAYALHPAWGAGLSAAMLAELVTGREAAIPLALATGTPPWLVAATSISQNLALAALLVPLAHQAMHAAANRLDFAGRFMQSLQESARARLTRGRSAWALFLFMLLPFVANGPVLAGLIGTMAGLSTRSIASAIVPAVVLTATTWTYAYAALTQLLHRIDERLALVPAILAAAITLVWLASATYRTLTRKPADLENSQSH